MWIYKKFSKIFNQIKYKNIYQIFSLILCFYKILMVMNITLENDDDHSDGDGTSDSIPKRRGLVCCTFTNHLGQSDGDDNNQQMIESATESQEVKNIKWKL